jgi:hypothetical protein
MPIFASAQPHEWSKMPAVEAYYTTLKLERYSASSGINPDESYYFNTINLAFSLPITERLRVGTQWMSVASRVIREPVDRSYAGSVFGQFNFRARKRFGIYAETGYALSNLCPCGNGESYSIDGINHFLQFGLGANIRVYNRFHIKAGFINYKPLRGPSDIYNWTQPFIGLKYHFLEKYNTPFKSRFRKPVEKPDKYVLFWEDERVRKWNVGFSSAGVVMTQHRSFPGQTTPLIRYREFVLVPRVNYWVNQAVLLGVQGTFYYYENNLDPIVQQNHGFGVGLQSRFYPLNFKNPDTFRAFRISKTGNWNISPIVGAEVHVANYSFLEPQEAGAAWQYFDAQPFLGFVLSYKQFFNLFWSVGPTLTVGEQRGTSPVNGIRIIGFEYNW